MLISMLAEMSPIMKVLSQMHVMMGIGLAMLGIALAILSKRIANQTAACRYSPRELKWVVSAKSFNIPLSLLQVMLPTTSPACEGLSGQE